jgi:hypothetical protein
MALNSIRCPVLGARVTRVTDLEGTVTRVICPEYDVSNSACRLTLSRREGGPLSQLVERVSENTPETKSTRCVLLTA